MWLHLLVRIAPTEMCHLGAQEYTFIDRVALTMKLFMILGALLLPATVEAYTFMSKSDLLVAVAAYDTDPTAAEATYGPIDAAGTSRVSPT